MSRDKSYKAGNLAWRQEHTWEDDCNGATEEVDNCPNCPWVIALPHQCDSWRIGSVAEGALMLADLQKALANPPKAKL